MHGEPALYQLSYIPSLPPTTLFSQELETVEQCPVPREEMLAVMLWLVTQPWLAGGSVQMC